MKIHIVFDGPPGPEAGRFVEVENDDGKSISAGLWKERADGFWELVIEGDDIRARSALAPFSRFARWTAALNDTQPVVLSVNGDQFGEWLTVEAFRNANRVVNE